MTDELDTAGLPTLIEHVDGDRDRRLVYRPHNGGWMAETSVRDDDSDEWRQTGQRELDNLELQDMPPEVLNDA